MEVPYVQNWEETEARLLAYWDKKIIGRIPISLTAPKPKNEQKPLPVAKDSYTKWMDSDFVVKTQKALFENTYFLAEAIPTIHTMATYTLWGGPMGGEPEFREETIWQHPFISDWKTHKFNFDMNSKWWELVKTIEKSLVEEKAGFPATSALVAAMDTLSMIRGPENLCMDLIENPELIKELRDKILKYQLKMFDEVFDIVQEKFKGSTGWLPLYSTGKYYTPQCDFCVMISEEMFDEFYLPELEAVTDYMDHSIYHLDGPGEVRHLDSILKVKKLNAVQWVPLPGDSNLNWIELFKRILKGGKCLDITVKSREVKDILKALHHEGLFLQVVCDSKEEAQEVIKLAEKMS